MESINKKILAVSVVLALLTSLLIYLYIKNATAIPDSAEYMNVYTAAKTLPARHKIVDADLRQIMITREFLNSKAVLSKADIVGKRLKDSVIEGEQILKDRLIDESKMSLAFSIPEGKRAVSINVSDQIGVSYMIRPGDFVDVIASFESESIEGSGIKIIYPRITRTIIQNIEILAIGQDQYVTGEKAAEPYKTVTLAVSPKEAESLVYASEYAVLRLALRTVGDNAVAGVSGVLRSDLTPDAEVGAAAE